MRFAFVFKKFRLVATMLAVALLAAGLAACTGSNGLKEESITVEAPTPEAPTCKQDKEIPDGVEKYLHSSERTTRFERIAVLVGPQIATNLQADAYGPTEYSMDRSGDVLPEDYIGPVFLAAQDGSFSVRGDMDRGDFEVDQHFADITVTVDDVQVTIVRPTTCATPFWDVFVKQVESNDMTRTAGLASSDTQLKQVEALDNVAFDKLEKLVAP